MNLTYLRYFMEVAGQLNMSKAANALFLSQPALSRTIKNFEKNLGVDLFERTNKGLKLTKAGEILYNEADQFFLADRHLMEKLHNATTENRIPLKILYTNDIFFDKLNRFSLHYNQNYGNQKFIIERHNWHSIRHSFRHGFADLAICLNLVFQDAVGINRRTLYKETNCIVLPKSDPLTKRKKISLYELKDKIYITPATAGAGDVNNLSKSFQKAGIKMVEYSERNNMDSVLIDVALGQGFSIIVRNLFPKIYKDVLVPVPCDDLGTEEFVVAWPKAIETANLLKVIEKIVDYKWL